MLTQNYLLVVSLVIGWLCHMVVRDFSRGLGAR